MSKQIELQVEKLNAKYPVGSKFYYHPVAGEMAHRFEPILVTTRTPFEPSPHGDAVWVWLEGRAGCFYAHHLEPEATFNSPNKHAAWLKRFSRD